MAASDSNTNEALVARAFVLFNARDAEGLVGLMDADGALYPFAINERRHEGYRGHDGLRQYVADVERMFEEFEVAISEVRDVGDGVVLAEGRLRGRTRDGVDLDMAAAWLWTVGSNGLITRMQAHPVSAPD